jgi:hypothetical protein
VSIPVRFSPAVPSAAPSSSAVYTSDPKP